MPDVSDRRAATPWPEPVASTGALSSGAGLSEAGPGLRTSATDDALSMVAATGSTGPFDSARNAPVMSDRATARATPDRREGVAAAAGGVPPDPIRPNSAMTSSNPRP